MNRRDEKLDSYLGKRVKIVFSDNSELTGRLEYDDRRDGYVLKNVVNKKGLPSYDTHFRKSHIRQICKKMLG